MFVLLLIIGTICCLIALFETYRQPVRNIVYVPTTVVGIASLISAMALTFV